MPTMPPPKAPPAPALPGNSSDPNANQELGTAKTAALVVLGTALLLATRGRTLPGPSKFIVKTATTTLVSAGALSMVRAPGHGDEQSKLARQNAIREALKQAQTMPSPSNQLVTIVGNKTGKRIQIPLEELQRLIDAGIIKVKNKKTGERIIKVEMKKPWLADP